VSGEFLPLESSVSRSPNYVPRRQVIRDVLGNHAITRSNTVLVYFVPELAMYNHIAHGRPFRQAQRIFSNHPFYTDISTSLVSLRYPSVQNLAVVQPTVLEDYYRQSIDMPSFSPEEMTELWKDELD
jgi:hypothetical protein